MPTPSNNSIAAAIARTTCPPEPERISAWRESSDTVSNNYPLDSLSPEIPIAPSMPSQSDGGSTPEPMKAEGKPTGVEEDDPVRATSPAESTCPRSQSPAATPGSSLLNWEFSNVRVSSEIDSTQYHATDHRHSFCRTIPHFFVQGASSPEPNNQIAKFTVLMSRLSMWIWLSRISVAILESKVCDSCARALDLAQLMFVVLHRPDRRSPYLDYLF
jgi:hypothetical protein